MIVDSQVHIWGADTPERPWPEGRATQAQKPYPVTADMVVAAMDEAGVDRAVLVPPSWEGDRNDLVLDAARRYPARLAAMGRLPLDEPNPSAVSGWRNQPGMLGLRFTFHAPRMRGWLTDGTGDWLWASAQEAHIPVMVFVPGAVPEMERIIRRYPELRFVIDHLALWGRKDDAAFEHLGEVLNLAKLPNVAVKASALPCYSSEPYPFPGLHRYIRQVFDTFGPRRTFWGTDWTRLPCTWREALTLFTEELPWLTEADKEWVMGRAVCEWLGWPME
jgi:predicted TIM-barrel fold metal-dependent hydrolase